VEFQPKNVCFVPVAQDDGLTVLVGAKPDRTTTRLSARVVGWSMLVHRVFPIKMHAAALAAEPEALTARVAVTIGCKTAQIEHQQASTTKVSALDPRRTVVRRERFLGFGVVPGGVLLIFQVAEKERAGSQAVTE
jgi:hypothetical protein